MQTIAFGYKIIILSLIIALFWNKFQSIQYVSKLIKNAKRFSLIHFLNCEMKCFLSRPDISFTSSSISFLNISESEAPSYSIANNFSILNISLSQTYLYLKHLLSRASPHNLNYLLTQTFICLKPDSIRLSEDSLFHVTFSNILEPSFDSIEIHFSLCKFE